MQNELLTLKETFKSNNVPMSDHWLEACATWCKEEVLGPNYTHDELKQEIHQQWLTTDLRDMEAPVLPPNISSQKYMTLNGKYSLQLMQIVDISRPKFWQLQQIRKENTLTRPSYQENDSIGNGKRVLLLTLTDGVQMVEAMEYTPINSLNINLTPGVKIRIVGPLTIRRGRIMLEERNFKVFGGEVEDLIIPNAVENVLAKHLNLKLNSNPSTVDTTLFNVDNTTGNFNTQNLNVNPYNGVSLNNRTRNINSINKDNTNLISNRVTNITSNNIRPKQDNNIMNEDDHYAEELEMLMEAERDLLETHPINPSRQKQKTPDLFDDELEDEILANIDTLPLQNTQNNSNYDDLVTDDFFTPSIENVQQKISIDTLKKHAENNEFGKYKIRAKFKSVYKKLDLENDEYQLSITLMDDTGDLNVKVDSSVVANWAGYDCSEILALKNEISKDVNARSKIENALQNIKNKLVELDGLLEIELSANEVLPVFCNVCSN